MMQPDARTIVSWVRGALEFQQEMQSGVAKPTTLIEELEQEASAGLRSIQAIVDDMARQERIWLGNNMTSALGDEKTELGGTFSRARWLEIKAVFDNFKTWMRTPIIVVAKDEEKGIEEVAVMPIVVVSRRSNPVEKVVTPPAPVLPQP